MRSKKTVRRQRYLVLIGIGFTVVLVAIIQMMMH